MYLMYCRKSLGYGYGVGYGVGYVRRAVYAPYARGYYGHGGYYGRGYYGRGYHGSK